MCRTQTCPPLLLCLKVPSPPFPSQSAFGPVRSVQRGQPQLSPGLVTSLDISEEEKEEEKVTCKCVYAYIQFNLMIKVHHAQRHWDQD